LLDTGLYTCVCWTQDFMLRYTKKYYSTAGKEGWKVEQEV
jgi:hypothetical protein